MHPTHHYQNMDMDMDIFLSLPQMFSPQELIRPQHMYKECLIEGRLHHLSTQCRRRFKHQPSVNGSAVNFWKAFGAGKGEGRMGDGLKGGS